MAHKKIIDSVKKQGQVAIKDLDEFLRFIINESDMRTYDDNYISILIPMKFDIDKVFGLDVCKRSDDDYVILYSCWYPNKDVFGRQFEMRLYHYDNSNDDDDLGLDIVMTQVTHHIITKRSDECLPISAFVPKHKEGDGKKFPVIIDIYGGDFVAGRSALNRNFGTWCAEHGYLTFIPEYTQVPETNLFGQLGDLLKAFVVIHRCAERYGADMSRMYLVGDGAGAALACLVYALLWNPVSMQHLEDELPFDVPQEAKLTFKAVCLQNGILDLSSRKMNAIAPYLIEKDWKKTSYAECLSPKTYAKMLPPCFLVTSITDAHKHDTNQLAWQLKLKGTRYSVHSANNLFAKESFAARHPETRYAQAANTAMLAFFENK